MPSGTATLFTAASFDGYSFEVTRTGKLDGLSTPAYATAETELAGVRGSKFIRAYQRKRQITLEFLVFVDGEDDYFTKRAAIVDAMHKEAGEGELLLTIHGTRYSLNCVPEPPEISWPHYPYFTVQAQFTAYDPIIYKDIGGSEAGISAPGGGGATFPLVFPITFETTASGSATITNGGNTYTYPILTLNDVLTNPLIRNTTNGLFFQLNYTSALGDEIVIDMKNRTVVLNGVTSLLADVVTGSSWWPLESGSNAVSFATGASSDTGTLDITWNDAYHSL